MCACGGGGGVCVLKGVLGDRLPWPIKWRFDSALKKQMSQLNCSNLCVNPLQKPCNVQNAPITPC